MKDNFVSMQCEKDNLVNKKHRNKHLKGKLFKILIRENNSPPKGQFLPFSLMEII